MDAASTASTLSDSITSSDGTSTTTTTTRIPSQLSIAWSSWAEIARNHASELCATLLLLLACLLCACRTCHPCSPKNADEPSYAPGVVEGEFGVPRSESGWQIIRGESAWVLESLWQRATTSPLSKSNTNEGPRALEFHKR